MTIQGNNAVSMEYLNMYNLTFQEFLTEKRLGDSIPSLYDPAEYIIGLGGKRLRPVMVLLAAHLYDNHFTKALDAAYAVEVFHNFSLVHDDIMDRADKRRGQPTVHQKYSVNQAILTGDVMLIRSYQHLLYYKPVELSNRLLDVFMQMSVTLCEGQQMDMDFEKRNDVTIDEYIRMIEGKTAVLLGAALQLGALIGGSGEEDALHLYRFGLNFGIAFQLQDDVLDTFGAADRVGKLIGGDILQNKKTYLYLKAIELGSEDQKKQLLHYYSDNHDLSAEVKIDRVTSIFKELLVREYAAQVMEAYRDLAISHVQSCNLSEEKKQVLMQFVNDYLHREY